MSGVRLSILALLLGLAAPASAAPDPRVAFKLKPGAAGAGCRECHTELSLAKLKHLHPHVKKDQCTACHDAHASDHGDLLTAEPRALCESCHPTQSDQHVHAPIEKEGCKPCHASHGSNQADLLTEAPAALCARCHKEVVTAAKKARFKHAPLTKDGCTKDCHTPHASREPALLQKNAQALCVGCHDPKKRGFDKKHGGYDVAEADCNGCHDPHGSSRRGMLYDQVHPPVAKGACTECHAPPAKGEAIAVKKPGVELCRDCHAKSIDAMWSKPFVHSATRDGAACSSCHAAHASPKKGLVARDLAGACSSCHADTVARHDRSPTKHAPIADGECVRCHDPHGGDDALLLTIADDIALCGQCHEWQRHSSHPIGPKYADPRNPNLTLDCVSCHRAHGTEFQHLMPFASSKLSCTQCHEKYKD